MRNLVFLAFIKAFDVKKSPTETFLSVKLMKRIKMHEVKLLYYAIQNEFEKK